MKDPLEGKHLRKKAEKILAEKIEAPQKVSSGDMEKLIHELRVHQVELEMQNDELLKAQAAIEESRSRYVELYDFAPVGYFSLDKMGIIQEANLTGANLLGVERERLLKTPFSLFVMSEDRDVFRECQRKAAQVPGRQSCELRLNRKAGDPLWVGLENVAVEAPDGKLTGMRLALSDITERKRSEEALGVSEKRLQDLASKLLSLQEIERKVIANEIHDGLLSDLAAVKFSLEAKISTMEKAGNPLPSDFQLLLSILQRTMKEARRIMNRLRPSILDEVGLIPALSFLCREFEELHPHIDLECKLEAKENEIPDTIKVVIFRVAQEAITNSVRHGGGASVKMSLVRSSNGIEFMAQDNGQGFNLEEIKKGAGLESMRERVELLGGTFRIESEIGHGTKIQAIWNLS